MIDKKTGKKSKHAPKFIKQGDSCIVRIETTQNVCLETYKDYPQLGRFTLRDEGILGVELCVYLRCLTGQSNRENCRCW